MNTTSILGHIYTDKFLYDAVYHVITCVVNSVASLAEHPFCGFTIVRTFQETSDSEIVISLLYRNDLIIKYDFPLTDDDNDIVDDAVAFFINILQSLQKNNCTCCSSIFYTTVGATFCVSCITSLMRMDLTETIDPTDNCVICLEPIGELDVGAFSCGKHHGHVKCIGMFNRTNTNIHYACPNRCGSVIFETYTFDMDDLELESENEDAIENQVE